MAISNVIVIDPHGEEKFSEYLSTVDRELAISEHNLDEESHPYLLQQLATKVDDIQVDGESAVTVVSGQRIVNLRKEQFGVVDGISVNGTDVTLDENGIADITVPTTVGELSDSSDYAKTTDISDLQSQINAIVAGNATVSLTASPTLVYANEQSTVGLTARVTDATASSITIKKGNTALATDTDKTQLTASDTITPSSNVSYSAEFVINGTTKTASATVAVVGKIYYGAGATEASAEIVAPKQSTPACTYNVTVSTTGHYVFFVIPDNMSITSATMSGFDFPLDAPTTTTRDGATYKAYKSSSPMDAGTYEITIK